ncbi:hypothetical protein A8B75_17415 [Sphingomonadales bacterium EhC05]|jgi:hypothetical protein|nr:hypothetical protein A8B75_17415 [Sphingomonadales bacterium EhC05]|tara:strand:+ start:123264 stop:123590 length:327 start_codon:yes stop_codon:yes gene_type:complete
MHQYCCNWELRKSEDRERELALQWPRSFAFVGYNSHISNSLSFVSVSISKDPCDDALGSGVGGFRDKGLFRFAGCGNLHVLVGRFGNAGGDAVCILERGNVTRSALVS